MAASLPPNVQHGRILALDLGSRRIGLAVTDALGITAQPLRTLNRKNNKADFAALLRLVRKHGVSEIVLGLPLTMRGESGTQAEKASAFAEELRAASGLPVHLIDERLTSAAAHRLLDESGLTREQRKGKVDAMAAVMILQSFLEARSIR